MQLVSTNYYQSSEEAVHGLPLFNGHNRHLAFVQTACQGFKP